MKPKKIYLLFIILLFYVVLQSIWWMYSLWNLSTKVFESNQLNSKFWMIVGEGSVFLMILTLGFILTYKAFKKEVNLSSQQKNFLMSITHELKTPLSAIKLYLQTLKKHELEKEKQEEIILKSIKDTERLNELIENALLATQISNHSYPLNFELINLSQLCKTTCIKLLESNTKNVELEFFIQDNIEINGDRNSFISIISNLVGNAIKYSPHEGHIKIGLKKEYDIIQLAIEDQGTGIPNLEKENIFKQFYRIGNENTRKEKGTGLGLFIVKHLVELHNGKISVKDNSPKGVIFACTFQIA